MLFSEFLVKFSDEFIIPVQCEALALNINKKRKRTHAVTDPESSVVAVAVAQGGHSLIWRLLV